MSWTNSSTAHSAWSQTTWGCSNNIVTYRSQSWLSIGGSTFTYIYQDFSADFTKPLTFSEIVSGPLFGRGQSPVIDTSVVFTTEIIYVNGNPAGHALCAFDIRDAHSGPDNSYLSKLADSSYKGGTVKEILIDESRKSLYVIGDSGISIYSYEIGPPPGIRNPVISRNSPSKRLRITQSSRGVCFNIIGTKIQSLQVLDAKGRIVRSVEIPAGETFVWNRRDNSGTAVPVGFYIYKIGTVKDGVLAGSMVIVR